MTDATHMLHSLEPGDGEAAAELLPLVYEELRRVAAAQMARQTPGATVQPTALVHEAWLRLSEGESRKFQNRAHFFGAAAEAMRRILIDRARSKARQKRGGGVPLEELHESRIQMTAPAEEVLAVHEALDTLAEEHALAAEVVKLRYYVGLTVPEVAVALDLSPSTVNRQWALARAWLKQAIRTPSRFGKKFEF